MEFKYRDGILVGVIEVKVTDLLTEEQWKRVLSKMYIVEEIAQRATNAMVKGTIKYHSDQHTKAEWQEHNLQDSMDAAIYPYFVRDEQWHGSEPTMPRGWMIEPYQKTVEVVESFEMTVPKDGITTFIVHRNGLRDLEQTVKLPEPPTTISPRHIRDQVSEERGNQWAAKQAAKQAAKE